MELKFNPDIELISAKDQVFSICMFDMVAEKFELAVDIKGDIYYVTGVNIDSFGDAHSENGFYNNKRSRN